ncbi:hypothetical protein [Paenibacillus sp. FSL K6-2524]|uniref:hypothetical protein n=1 Tax=Paenibacillus sp. FSL K6-2524 TaxID=2954516 RepID=UPI0030F9679E
MLPYPQVEHEPIIGIFVFANGYTKVAILISLGVTTIEVEYEKVAGEIPQA